MAGDESIQDKQARLHRLSHLLYRHPKGLTVREMAQICNVTPRTIQRDLKALEEAGVPIWQEDEGDKPRYGIIAGYFLPPLRLTLNDAAALYLAARLLTRNTDEYNPHVASAVAQLAGVLPEAMGNALQLAIQAMANRAVDVEYRDVFEALTLGWATGRKVLIRYLSPKRDEASEYVLHPYFVEPGERGNTYVVGRTDHRENLITFKLDRILAAQLLEETFEVPEDVNPSQVLAHSWGIVFGEKVEEVVLRFIPEVARRIDETTWHPSQKVEVLDNGGRLLRLRVSGTFEIEPWVRTWGSACEVLAPATLRQKMIAEARALAALYDIAPAEQSQG
ncbi:MAG: transcriptional regulator [Ardenticatenales bacterium]|nr:transcriptional regulator [Ardenticatenales bacterium]